MITIRKRHTPEQKEKALKYWKLKYDYDYKKDIIVAEKFQCHERTLWKWRRKYDGTLASLTNKSSCPKTPDKKTHKPKEDNLIKRIFKIYPDVGLNEKYGRLVYEKKYIRSYEGFKKRARKLGFNIKEPRTKIERQIYHCATVIGGKVQFDVKYVPDECLTGKALLMNEVDNVKFYQYTAKDEASKEVFKYWYSELCGENTKDFTRRYIQFCGCIPQVIQTDNGKEFCHPHAPTATHIFGEYCRKLRIIHKRVPPRTPWQQGQVETVHRIDNEQFYSKHIASFSSLEDLRDKGKLWNYRQNNYCTHRKLKSDITGKRHITPNHKRKDFLTQITQGKITEKIRLLKNINFIPSHTQELARYGLN
ncbi:MAG: hypothetical protein FWE01_00735 [Firmicutes bacterium]|nr:hypothetical protein [Bacillota bacterium]